MVTLYPTYTVTVSDSVTRLPRNDLQLYLFEGEVEIKVNPTSSKNDIYQLGTTTLATKVMSSSSIDEIVLAADTTNRPGEYDFIDIDFTKTTASDDGTTLYSVVAIPNTDTDFTNARVIVENICISDPNIKQSVRAAFGGQVTIEDNMAWAGGSVTFEQYDVASPNVNDDKHQFLKLNNLPAAITSQVVDDSATPTLIPSYATGLRLVARFDVHYSDSVSMTKSALVWTGIPAYKDATGSWIIKVSNDQYNVLATTYIGAAPGLDLSAIYLDFVVSVNLQDTNIYVRKYDTTPATAIPYLTVTKYESPIIHTFYNVSTKPIVGIGSFFDYSTTTKTPSVNLDVAGDLGVRYRKDSGSILFRVNSSQCTIGDLDTFNYEYLNFATGEKQIWVNSKKKLDIADTLAVMSDDYAVAASPTLYAANTSSGLALGVYSTATTYIRVNSANTVEGGVGSGTSKQFMSVSATATKLGFDIGGTIDSYFYASSSYTRIVSKSTYLIMNYINSSQILYLGSDVTTYPYTSLKMQTNQVTLYGGQSTYLNFTNTVAKMYVDDGSGLNTAFCYIDSQQNIQRFGYLADTPATGTYFKTDSNYEAKIVVQGTTRFLGGTAIGSNLDTRVLSANQTNYLKIDDYYIRFYLNSAEMLVITNGGGSFGLESSSWGFRWGTSEKYLLMGKKTTGYNISVTGDSLTTANYKTEGITLQMGGDVGYAYTPDTSLSAALSYISRSSGVFNGKATWKIPVIATSAGVYPSNTASGDLAREGGMFLGKVGGVPLLIINYGTDTAPIWGKIAIASV